MGDSLTARVKMQHSLSTSTCRPRPRVHAAFLHLQCANRSFRPLVSKYTIVTFHKNFVFLLRKISKKEPNFRPALVVSRMILRTIVVLQQ